jgi:hypothetical protein
MTDESVKGLLAKFWKDEPNDLEPGRHFCDEVWHRGKGER